MLIAEDHKTYALILEIKALEPGFWDWVLPMIGDWHVRFNMQPVVLKIFFDAGLNCLAPSAGFASSTARNALVDGRNWKRNNSFLMQGFEASLWPMEVQELRVSTWALWWHFTQHDCLPYVTLYFATRTSDWQLRCASLKMLAPLAFAWDMPHYQRVFSSHLTDVRTWPASVLQLLSDAHFAVSINERWAASVACDEAHEMVINLDLKQCISRPSEKYLRRKTLHQTTRAASMKNLDAQVPLPPRPLPEWDYKRTLSAVAHMTDTINSAAHLMVEHDQELQHLVREVAAEPGAAADLARHYTLGIEGFRVFI
eukprot:jgi/Chlat1/2444/Chrsp171S02348